MKWVAFPDERMACSGLFWIKENAPDLWRFPKHLAPSLPEGVWQQMCFPSGGRICLKSDTSELHVRIRFTSGRFNMGMDVYVDGQFWGTTPVPKDGESDVVCFAGAERVMKEVAVYLPLRNEIQILAYGIDSDAKCEMPGSHIKKRPIVLYGSSVAQGIGVARPGMSYSSILSRSLHTDCVNLGFGGAGKAEENVVSLVSQIEACCYLLDLGKSYGMQTAEAYKTMLQNLRHAHPATPIVCITPIFSSREFFSDSYRDLSHHTRTVVRESVADRLAQGDGLLFLVEGETLLSSQDTDGLASDGVHPNDFGHFRIAERLQLTIADAIQRGIRL